MTPPPASAPLRGVLRGERARLAPRPFEVVAAWDADVPVDAVVLGGPDAVAAPEPVDVGPALEGARAEGYDAGYEAGYAAALAFAEAELAETRAAHAAARVAHDATAAADAAALHAAYEAFFRRSEPVLAELAVGAAEVLFDAPLAGEARDAAFAALAAAVERFAGGPVTLALPPEDLERLQTSGLADHLERHQPALRWRPDPALDPGDWTVEADEGAVRRVRRELVATLRAHLGLPGATPADDAP